jgi:hypothetical protein
VFKVFFSSARHLGGVLYIPTTDPKFFSIYVYGPRATAARSRRVSRKSTSEKNGAGIHTNDAGR